MMILYLQLGQNMEHNRLMQVLNWGHVGDDLRHVKGLPQARLR